MRIITLASLLSVLAAGPASAWDYSEYWTDMDVWVSTYQNDSGMQFQLALNCSDLFPDDSDLAIYTPEAWDASASYAPEVPLTVTVDGVPTGPLAARFEASNGKVAVVAYETSDARVRPLFELIRQARTSIVVSYFDKTLSFDVAGAEYMVGKYLMICNGEPAF